MVYLAGKIRKFSLRLYKKFTLINFFAKFYRGLNLPYFLKLRFLMNGYFAMLKCYFFIKCCYVELLILSKWCMLILIVIIWNAICVFMIKRPEKYESWIIIIVESVSLFRAGGVTSGFCHTWWFVCDPIDLQLGTIMNLCVRPCVW